MKKRIKRFIKRLLPLLPGRRYVLLESVPDCSDNTKAVFDYLLVHSSYRFLWLVSDASRPWPKHPRVRYIDRKGFFHRLVFAYRYATARAIICCNEFWPKLHARQLSVYLGHGPPFKSIRGYYTVPQGIDWVTVASEGVRELCATQFNAPLEKCVPLGLARNDRLLKDPVDLHTLFEGEFSRVAVWYPTFRQHKNEKNLSASNTALPLIHDGPSAARLNDIARELGVLLVIKPHFAQDLSYVKSQNLSHLRFIDDSFFVKHHLDSYQFVGSCDALISDYSSILFDYLLCNKPVALVWEDMEAYAQSPGFALDPQEAGRGAYKIYTMEDMQAFLQDLSQGLDPLAPQRSENRDWANLSPLPDNAARVGQFVLEKLAR